jgi:hypothetical protein
LQAAASPVFLRLVANGGGVPLCLASVAAAAAAAVMQAAVSVQPSIDAVFPLLLLPPQKRSRSRGG